MHREEAEVILARKRSAGQRDKVKSPTGTFFAKRTSSGRFKEMDEVGRAVATDRRTAAKRKVRSGHGDEGDRPTRGAKR